MSRGAARLRPRWRPAALSYSMQFALLLSAVFSLAALVAGGVSYVVLSEELRSRLYDDARLAALGLAKVLETGGAAEAESQIRALAGFDDDASTLYYLLPAGRGEALGDMALPAPFEGPRRLVAGADFALRTGPGPDRGEVYFAFGVRRPGGRIVVARDSQWISDGQEVLAQAAAWGLGVALLATILLAVALARRNAIRIDRLNRVLAAAAEGDLAARFPDAELWHDDIAQVARGINAMLAKLQSNVERLQQVSADIAHDLRAPLTRLRLRLEPHAGRADLAAETRDAIAGSLEAIEGIAATFDAILKLAQIEGGGVPLRHGGVDLNDVARSVHEMLAPVAEDMGHALRLSVAAAPVRIRGDADLLTQALVNLVDNAFRHCPAPARIELAVRRDGDRATMSVCDDGPGVPAAERDNVTRRFYRLDASRNRPGAGLGLSLVAAIAALHGGGVELSDHEPGLCVAMTFPPSA